MRCPAPSPASAAAWAIRSASAEPANGGKLKPFADLGSGDAGSGNDKEYDSRLDI
jgi:hypothetical protein